MYMPVRKGSMRFHESTMAELFERIDAVLDTIARDVGVIERQERLR